MPLYNVAHLSMHIYWVNLSRPQANCDIFVLQLSAPLHELLLSRDRKKLAFSSFWHRSALSVVEKDTGRWLGKAQCGSVRLSPTVEKGQKCIYHSVVLSMVLIWIQLCSRPRAHLAVQNEELFHGAELGRSPHAGTRWHF